MSETNPTANATERQKQPDTAAAPVLDWGVGMLLEAQADMLAGTGAAVTDWLHRRHEAVLDTRQLIANMHVGADPAETFKAQRDFVSRSFQRFAAEVDACQTTTQKLLERTPAWFPQGGWAWFPRISGSTETASAQAAAATRAAGRSLRMANKPD
jgi:hypothetical protein